PQAPRAWRRPCPCAIRAARATPSSPVSPEEAEMPFEWVATRCAAMNHVRSGGCLPSIIAPAVADVWRPHSAHFQRPRFRVELPAAPRPASPPAQTSSSGESRHELLERPRQHYLCVTHDGHSRNSCRQGHGVIYVLVPDSVLAVRFTRERRAANWEKDNA